MDETLKYSHILIDVETVQRWLADQGVSIDWRRAERIIDYIYQDVLDEAYDLVIFGNDDLKED